MIKTKLFEKKRNKESQIQRSQSPYITAAWEQHANLLTQLCEYSQNIILVTAPLGGGKTTFLNHFFQIPSKTLRKETILVSKQDTMEGFIAKIGLAFDVEFKQGEHWYKSIRHALNQLSESQICTLLIDDAHCLGIEQLKVLLELTNPEEKHPLRIVLFTEPSLELRLFSPDFNSIVQGRVYTVELESWSMSETKRYLTEYCGMQLDQTQLTQIFERSHGLPGNVLQEKDIMMNQPEPEGVKMTKRKNWRIHPISLGILVGVIAGGSYLMLNSKLEEENATPPTNSAQATENGARKEVAQDEVRFHFDKVDKSDPVESDSTNIAHEELIVAPTEVKPEPAIQPAVTEQQAQVQAPKVEEQVAANNVVPPAPQAAQPSQDVVIVTKQPEVTKPKVEEPKPKAAPIAQNLSPEEKYLLSVGKERYTIQLLGASKEENVRKFILNHALADKTYRFRTKRANRDWFVVVYGDFATKEEAKAAMKDMPDSLKKTQLQPWVRDFEGVHTDIAKTKS